MSTKDPLSAAFTAYRNAHQRVETQRSVIEELLTRYPEDHELVKVARERYEQDNRAHNTADIALKEQEDIAFETLSCEYCGRIHDEYGCGPLQGRT